MSLDVDDVLQPGNVRLYVANLSTADGSTDLVDLGNIVSPSLATDIATLEHFTNRSGRRTKDKEVVTQISAGFEFSFDEMNIENMRFFLYGSASSSAANVSFPDGTTADLADQFNPLVNPLRDVAFEFMVKPTEGPAFLWTHDVAQFKANGSFDLDDENWAQAPCRLEVLSSTVDGQEFGTFSLVSSTGTFS